MSEFRTITNLCYILNDKGEVLLQHKSRGFGKGKWNGPGGKMKAGESVEQSVAREVKEETGLDEANIKKAAELEFIFNERPEWNNFCHIFICRDYTGKMKASDEGELKWFKINDLPFDLMWPDDVIWLRDALAGGRIINMRFYFDAEGKLLKYEKI